MIFTFLNEVLQHAETNKMTAANIAVVVGPNVIRSPNDQESIQHFGLINSLAEILVSNATTLFEVSCTTNRKIFMNFTLTHFFFSF